MENTSKDTVAVESRASSNVLQHGISAQTTQRAYTLRLRGVDPSDTTWREALWATHEAVNLGARAFGDWLLTLRGGCSAFRIDVMARFDTLTFGR